MSQLPFSLGAAAFHTTTNHQPVYTSISTSNAAVPSSVPQAQQAAFMQNAQLPGIGIDMAAALQGITPEQLAIIGQLYQSGQIPLPPAANPPATQKPTITAQSATTANVASQSTEGQEIYPTAVNQGMAYVNQEHRGFRHPPPTSPRKRSGSVHMRPASDGVDKRTKRQQSPPQQPQGYDRRRPEPRTGKLTFVL